MGSVIDQDRNYRADFGNIFRSSAIFYKPPGIRTTVTVSNYWDFKNSLEIGLMFSLRDMEGKLVNRHVRYFEDQNVLNFGVDEIEEGSVEIEAFGNKNLRIPYAAVMAIYETQTSVSMVHSYGRNHSLTELEDGNSLTTGRESCWTLRSAADIENLAVFHNGHLPVEKQTGRIIITSRRGENLERHCPIDVIPPYATLRFDLEERCPGYKKFLDGEDGWATIHFNNHSSFTRLLIVWRHSPTGHVQVTHSNFDYTAHSTNTLKAEKPAYMKIPAEIIDRTKCEVVVYPKFTQGKYTWTLGDQQTDFETGTFISMTETDNDCLAFARQDGELPARIVTAISGELNNNLLPFECSLGIIHEKRPPKRFHWATVSARLRSKIYLTEYSEIYGRPDGPLTLIFRLYCESNSQFHESVLDYENVEDLPSCLPLNEIFENSDAILGDSFGYVSLFCSYGGLFILSSMQKESAFTLEHSF
ncbi:MAG: hypothetical protein MK110_01030 [Fuerstiella sp.]|nr:hypothetical protein [Fuerstiella sp.]